jgi:hypothetical protein
VKPASIVWPLQGLFILKTYFESDNAMIKLKKAVFAFGLGLGMAVSLNAWALPDCDTCAAYKADCDAGVSSACTFFIRYSCGGRCNLN